MLSFLSQPACAIKRRLDDGKRKIENMSVRTGPQALETLQRAGIFADLSPTEMQFLAERAVPRDYAPGELIFSEGEMCTGLFVVEKGHVRIFKSSPNGREQVLSIEGPGGSIAELPVFDGGNYPASTSAVDEARVYFVSKQDFYSLCLVHPKVALKVLKVVGTRLRRLVAIIEELSFTSVRSRLIGNLLRLAAKGKKGPGGVEIQLPASNQELASQIGTVRELVSRNLSRLQAEGLIRMDGKTLLIPDLARLKAELADGE
jgi:CRP/FNR family transcriptional regulator, cyclic AMP receptor protein